jgi:hypothetical protein
MHSGSSTNPATYLVEKPASGSPDDPWMRRDHPAMGRNRLEQRVCLRRQESTRGLRLINLERRARFCSFT